MDGMLGDMFVTEEEMLSGEAGQLCLPGSNFPEIVPINFLCQN